MTGRRISVILGLAGAVACAAALGIILIEPASLVGWLAAFAFWSSVSIGGLFLLMMQQLIPGPWREALGLPSEAATLLVPLAAIAFLPILAGLPSLYEWASRPAGTGFRAVYLTPGFFSIRGLLFFTLLTIAGLGLLLRRGPAKSIAAVGLLAFVPLHTVMAFDWLLSLDVAMHGSGFGLYILALQVGVALSVLVLMRGGGTGESELLGKLLLVTTLLWAYASFMQFFIIWSDNLPAGVAWYQRRGEGGWLVVAWLMIVPHLMAGLALLFPPVRREPRALVGVASLTLLCEALECLWLALPSQPVTLGGLSVAALGIGGLGLLGTAGLLRAIPLVRGLQARRSSTTAATL